MKLQLPAQQPLTSSLDSCSLLIDCWLCRWLEREVTSIVLLDCESARGVSSSVDLFVSLIYLLLVLCSLYLTRLYYNLRTRCYLKFL